MSETIRWCTIHNAPPFNDEPLQTICTKQPPNKPGRCDLATYVKVVGPVYRLDKYALAQQIIDWTYEAEGETTLLELLDEVLVEVGEETHSHVYDGDSVFCAVCGKSRGKTNEVGEDTE